MKLIVAADKNWAIGNKGRLLVTIPEDQKLFRQETLGKVIVMGRKTMESLPGGQALPGRTNVVLTRNRDYKKKGVTAVHGAFQGIRALPPGLLRLRLFPPPGQTLTELPNYYRT